MRKKLDNMQPAYANKKRGFLGEQNKGVMMT